MIKKAGQCPAFFIKFFQSGESGIRTLETLLEPTRSPGVRLRPLGQLSPKKNY